MSTKTFDEMVFRTPTADGGSLLCIGVSSGLFPGLAVHEDFEPDEWVVSHMATGHRISTDSLGLSLAEALDLAASLGRLTNWSELRTVDDARAFARSHRDELRALGVTTANVQVE